MRNRAAPQPVLHGDVRHRRVSPVEAPQPATPPKEERSVRGLPQDSRGGRTERAEQERPAIHGTTHSSFEGHTFSFKVRWYIVTQCAPICLSHRHAFRVRIELQS